MKRNELEAMTIICNIQQMQKVCYGQSFDYNQFNGNSIDELRDLQNSLIPLYNKAIKEINNDLDKGLEYMESLHP